MIFKYISGNNYLHSINRSKIIISHGKIPVINFAIENKNNKLLIYKEYEKLFNHIDNNFKIALKLSSFDFDKYLINDIIEIYKTKDIKVLIDAENNYHDKIYHNIINDLILNHNKDNMIIYKTYQMYRKDSFSRLIDEINFFEKLNYHLGIKLVRGAYWYQEKNTNELFIHKIDTDSNYNNMIEYLHTKNNSKISTILATHNTLSINQGVIYNQNTLDVTKHFEFGHLLGMKEKKYNKDIFDYNINVYIPYGPYHNMLPYLMRRLYENIDTIKYM